MNHSILNFRKLVVFLSSILVCFVVCCPAADQPIVLVVARDGARLLYRRNEPIDTEEIPKGTELRIESTCGEKCFVTYKGKPAYIRRQLLATKQEFFESEQKGKGLVQYQGKWIVPDEQFRQEQAAKRLVEYQGEWLTPAEKFRREQTAKGLVEYDGHWLTPEDKKTAIQKNLTEAVEKGDSTKFEQLLNANTDLIDATNSEGLTLLHIATAKSNKQAMQILLGHGANVNAQDKNGNTPHQLAEKLQAKMLTVPELVPIFRGMTKGEVIALLGHPNVVSRDKNEFQYYNKAYSVLKNSHDTILLITFHADIVHSVGLNGEQALQAD